MADERHDERYQQRGVSAGKSEVHAAIDHQDGGLYPGAFCKIVPDVLTASEEHALVIHADGAGTKSSLAYLAWKVRAKTRRTQQGVVAGCARPRGQRCSQRLAPSPPRPRAPVADTSERLPHRHAAHAHRRAWARACGRVSRRTRS
jgi:hypothetical protein